MNLIRTTLHLGAAEPFCLLHASDTHLTRADERDDARKLALAQSRSNNFPKAEQHLQELTELAQQRGLTVVHTGDLIDFVSAANIDAARDFANAVDCFMAAGNHEFSLYVGEAKEDAAYRNISLERIDAAFKNDIRFASRIINGVNFVALDNSYYLVEQWQLDRLREEAEKGFPIVLALHTPLYSQDMYRQRAERGAVNPAYLMSVPEELMRMYAPDRYEQQLQDEVTAQAYRFITESDTVKAILAGHLHKDYETEITPQLRQYVTGIGAVREIVID